MNLVELLLSGNSKANQLQIQRYVGSSSARFGELVSVFLNGPYRVTQRASHPLSHCAAQHPELVKPHLSKIVKSLRVPGQHDSIKRNVLRLLQFVDIPAKLQGEVTNLCFGFLEDRKEAIAIRAFAMTVLGRIAAEEPDLRKELEIIIRDEMPYESSGFNARARRVLKELGTGT